MQDLVIGNSLERYARSQPKQLAIIFEDETYTYDELNRIVNRLSHGIHNLGVKKGTKVALMMNNSPYFPIAYFSVIKLGGVIVPINCRLSKREVAYILDHSDAEYVIYDEMYGELLEEARSKKVKALISVHEATIPGHLSYNAVITDDESNPDITVDLSDTIEILYTSGTTGQPKGVVLTHSNVLTAIIQSIPFFGHHANNRALNVAPFFHSAQLRFMLRSKFLGYTNIILREFDPEKVLEAIEKHRITMVFAVPTMYNMFLQVPNKEKYDLSSVTTCGYGAAPMAPELISQSMELFGTENFFNQCGLTEGGPGGILLSPEEHKTKLGASGRPRFLTEARVVDEHGNDVAPGETGELIIRGGFTMQQYYKNPEETAKTLRDGWLYTGDLCTIDEDGYMTLVDRKKDMIISGGSNVYSVEVEQVLYYHDSVLEAAVLGVPDDKWGEIVTAILVLKPGYTATAEEIQDFCRIHLASYKIPRIVYFIDEIPRNASGKIVKPKLRELILAEQIN